MMTGDAPGAVRGVLNGAPRGRWIWIASAVATAAIFIAAVTTAAHVRKKLLVGSGGPWLSTSIRTVTFRQPVNALDVHDYGGPVVVSAGGTGGAQVTETVRYNGAFPRYQRSVANGRLTLADPSCTGGQCSIAFQVTVPAGTAARLESDGAPITVSGLARPVSAYSDGGPLVAQAVTAGLNAQTGGGALSVRDESGALTAGTGGGPADAEGIAATNVTVSTGGGAATLAFTAVPRDVQADSGGGPVMMRLPGGSYAVSADSGGGPQQIGIGTAPASPDVISVSSGGGAVSLLPEPCPSGNCG